jgi:predicted O-linked N-acetylglucosamine transferase (SPINDLY family)
MDWRISDPYLDNAETEKDYNEKILYLPNSYWCYRPPGESPVVSPSPAAVNGFVTFGCLNNFAKISLAAQKAWSEILTVVRSSRLIMTTHGSRQGRELAARFASWGIDENRLEFVDRLPWHKYMEIYRRVDIALDPFPYGGGISTCDALWMGVGVVSLAGKTAVGRSGKSILSNVGLPDMIGNDIRQYISIAVELAGDLPRLKSLRENLRERMRRSPLMNAGQFAADLESLYCQAWRKYCTGDVA